MVSVSASVNLPLHHKVQKFSSGIGSPVWSRKKNRKMVVVWLYMLNFCFYCKNPVIGCKISINVFVNTDMLCDGACIFANL